MKESLILRSILDYLAARHIFAVRMNAGTQIGSYKGKKWAIHMNAAGTADILAFPKGEFTWVSGPHKTIGNWTNSMILWIEVKNDKGKQSELQASFQEKVENEGHRYIVARSIADVEAALN